MDELPLWVRSGGLLIEPRMPGRLVAWLRRSDGGWVVGVDVSSPNRRSSAAATMWLPAGDVSPADEQSP